MKSFAALLLALLAPLQSQAAVISFAERLDATGTSSTFTLARSPNNFNQHTQIYHDTSFTYRNVPGYLSGADAVRTRFSDSQDADYQLHVTLEVPAKVFLVIDDRIEDVATIMPWLASMGFVDTGDSADYLFSGTYVRTLSVYSGNFPAGDLVLPQQDSPLVDGVTLCGMYTVGAVAIVPEPGSAPLVSVGLAVCLMRRRGSGRNL